MTEPTLKKTISKEQIRFYLKSCKYYRFPFFDPRNCYRKSGLFDQLEEALDEIGRMLQMEYGQDFLSINLRGSWLRGIPIWGDDVDALFIVNGLPQESKRRILDYTRKELLKKNSLFKMCEGKIEAGRKVEPISFLDLKDVPHIMNKYIYGLGHFVAKYASSDRDEYQDDFFGSKLTAKKRDFLKSGILIPYVGWIYGRDRKKEVFDVINRFLPIPTRKVGVYSEKEIDETKETLRQAFIARNLVYPSLELKKVVRLTNELADRKEEAMGLYENLAPLEEVYARAVINFLYTVKIEKQLLDGVVTPERIEKFAPTYDQLVYDIKEKAYQRLVNPPVKLNQ
jgi:hypothetical protein